MTDVDTVLRFPANRAELLARELEARAKQNLSRSQTRLQPTDEPSAEEPIGPLLRAADAMALLECSSEELTWLVRTEQIKRYRLGKNTLRYAIPESPGPQVPLREHRKPRPQRKPPRDRQGFIYFAGDKKHSPIKIGFATNVANRLASLRCASWEDIVCLGSVPGTESQERALHKYARWHRISGEWFTRQPALMLLHRVQEDGVDVVLSQPWVRAS